MQKITLIGTGNIAWHLSRGIAACTNFELVELVGRASSLPPGFEGISRYTNVQQPLQPTDIIIIAVADGAIAEVAEKVKEHQALVVHTSGSIAQSQLIHLQNHGVLYPLQTFTKGNAINLQNVPFCIEANSAKNLARVQELASALSQNVQEMDSKTRAAVHFSAVLANNFTNHLLTLTAGYCEKHAICFELLKPLVEETINKAFALGPLQAQTGPARRGDYTILKKQRAAIQDDQLQKTYTLFTNSILKTYGKEEL